MAVQAVVFPSFWAAADARAWLAAHGYTPIKRAHRTANQLRYRIQEPTVGAKYFTKRLPNGVNLVIAL